jgi:hypothetical protein
MVSTSPRVGIDFHIARVAVFPNPADRIAFFHPRQFDNGAILPKSFADALVALFVRHLHAAGIRRNADVVCHKDQYCIRIRVLRIRLYGSELFLVRPAPEQILDPADEENLEGRHQGRCPGAVKHLGEIGFRQIELEQAEVAEFGWH